MFRRVALATSCVLVVGLVVTVVTADAADRERLLVAAGAALVGFVIVVVTRRRMTPGESLFDFGPMSIHAIAGLLFLMAVLFIADAIRSP